MNRHWMIWLAALFFTGPLAAADKPNVLLIPIDDLNDWVGCLDGHPQAKTPNIDALAKRGVLFANAHCQAPVCNPSRVSMLTGLYPESTGIYFLSPGTKASRVAKRAKTLTSRYRSEGYHVAVAGKLYHTGGGRFGGFGPYRKKKLSPFKGHSAWDWGAFPENDGQMPDAKIAAWGTRELAKKRDQPFFIATGFYRPHVPQYVPQKWFDLYPGDTLQLPKVVADDLKDISKYAESLTRLKHVAPTHEWVVKNDQWKPLVRSYLACVSFVDAQVGKVVAALDKSGQADNTIIVLYSDHGFHLGEKERWAKRSLWEDGTRVPMIIVGPGVAKGKVCTKPVELIDVYPTLLEMTGLKADPKHEGQSLLPLLKNPDADWPHMARTSFGPRNVAIKSERYRYIRYNDGSEEFYDHADDPHEWHNRIKDDKLADVIAEHRSRLPKKYHPLLPGRSTGHSSFKATEEKFNKK
ncbi:MAG: sulfatase [Phycisphaeraceae bacterium]|nr:sulfatase [Phycisphaeraceae bacterium]